MKLKIFMVLAAGAALTLSSCNDFLDVKSEGSPASDSFFQTDADALGIIAEPYQLLSKEDWFGRTVMWEQAAACDIVWGRTRSWPQLATFQLTEMSSGPWNDMFWHDYKIMSGTNFIIANLLNKQDNKKALTAIEKRTLGEAYFLRAFGHFYAAYHYGTDKRGVPFVQWEKFPNRAYDSSIPPQMESVMKDYELVIEDLDKAKELLPRFQEYGDDNFGRAHQAACVGYKARAYAYWACWDATKWQNVIDCVNELESQYGCNLAPDFLDNFTSDTSKWRNAEYLFSVPSRGGTPGGGIELPGVMLENKGWGVMNGWGQIKPSLDIYEEMAKDNVNGVKNYRLKCSILEYNDEFLFFGKVRKFYSASDVESGFQWNKYMEPFGKPQCADPDHPTNEEFGNWVNPNADWPTCLINFPLLRFANVLLLRAEAYLMTGDAGKAAADINRVRTRSGLKPLTGNATWADLYHEVRCETACEYGTDHLFDLKRWYHSGPAEIKALASTELNKHPDARHYQDRLDPESTFTVGPYEDYNYKTPYQDYMMVFPYYHNYIVDANGALIQNDGY